MEKVYVASSWRNSYQREVVERLRNLGYRAYDFRSSGTGWDTGDSGGGFSWKAIDPNWQNWTPKEYIRALEHPLAVEGFDRDMQALQDSDIIIMVMPCGPSASMEFGWGVGVGKRTAIYIPATREPDLMILMADIITNEWQQIEDWL